MKKQKIDLEEKILVYTNRGIGEFFCKSNMLNNTKDFVVECESFSLRLQYLNMRECECIERILNIKCKKKIIVYKIEKYIHFSEKIVQWKDYKTFRCASTAAFIRFNGFGLFTGFANPFFSTKLISDYEIKQHFEPSIILEKDEQYFFDVDFLKIYPLSGEKLYERTPRTPLGDYENGYFTRYHNPDTSYPLDWAEI